MALSASDRAFLDRPLVADIATINSDGSPHLSYVWYRLEGDDILVSTTTDRQKTANLRRDNRVTLGVLDPDNPYRWLSVSGRASFRTEGAPDLIAELAVRYLGEAQGRERGKHLRQDPRITLVIRPEKVVRWGF